MSGLIDFLFGGDEEVPPAPPARDLGQEIQTIIDVQAKNLPRQLEGQRLAQTEQTKLMRELYRDIIGPMSREQSALGRAADIEQFGVLAPKAARSILEADPEQAALRAELNRQILEDLKAGSSLTDLERQNIEQSTRAKLTRLGRGYGRNDVAAEAIAEYLGGANLRSARQGRALSLLGANQGTLGDLFMAVTGRPSQSVGYAQNAYGQAAAGTPNLDPFANQYGADLFNTNYNAQYQNRWQTQQMNAAQAQAQGDLLGSLIGAAGGMGAAALMPAAFV